MASRKGIVHELARRLGAEGLAARLAVTPATIRRWLKNGLPPSRQEALRQVKARSDRARQAAKTRRFDRARDEVLTQHGLVDERGAAITGRQKGPHLVLTAMIAENDPAWLEFLQVAQDAGRNLRETKARWYSPMAKKMKRKKGRKKRKK